MRCFPERSRVLFALGLMGASLYVLVALVFWSDAVFDRPGVVRRVLYAISGILTILYFAGIRWVRDTDVRTVVFFAVLFAGIGFLSGPVDSTDVYFYMAQGWGQSNYHANPYSQVLRDIPNGLDDPMIGSRWMHLSRNQWLDEPLPYGFAFAVITRAVAWVGSGNLWLTLLLFDLLNLGVHAAVSVLLWKTAKILPGTDHKLIFYLYSWSPLVVLQFLTDLHNDLIMAALILLGFFLWLKQRAVWVLPCLVAAGFVKYIAFALVPFALLLVLRRYGRKSAAKSVVLSICLTLGLSLPYVSDFGAFRLPGLLGQWTEHSGSLHAFLRFTYRAVAAVFQEGPVDMGNIGSLTNILLWSIVGACGIWQLLRAQSVDVDRPLDVASQWTTLLFAIVFVGSSQFYPWYVGMLLPLSLVTTGSSLLTEIIVLLSGTHMAFGFVRNRAIGYFVLATMVPIAVLIWHKRSKAISRVRSNLSIHSLPEFAAVAAGTGKAALSVSFQHLTYRARALYSFRIRRLTHYPIRSRLFK